MSHLNKYEINELCDKICESKTSIIRKLDFHLCSTFWGVADVEGAFLQGKPLERKQGRLFVKIPREGILGQTSNDVVEVLKCVYGLCDAPRAW